MTEPLQQESLAYQRRALDESPSCAIVIDLHGRIEYANEAANDVMGIGDYVGRQFGEYLSDYENEENDEFYDALFEAVLHKGELVEGRYPFVSPNGKRHVYFVTLSAVALGEDEPRLVINCTDVSAEEDARRLRQESTNVLLICIVFLSVFAFLYAMWEAMGNPVSEETLTNIVEIGAVFFGVLILRTTSLGLDGIGLSFKNLKENLKIDIIVSACIVVFWIAVKLLLLWIAPGVIPHPEPFVNPEWLSIPRILGYAFTALVQEFLSRGVLQESLLHILEGPHSRAVAIIASTLIFTTLHLHYGPAFMAFAALMLGVFGILYDRQRSIWGLTIIHFTFGITAFLLGLTV